MKLSEYIKNLNETFKSYGDLDVVYSIDDEGNDFNRIAFAPSVGHYFEEEREWITEEDIDYSIEGIHINSICVN